MSGCRQRYSLRCQSSSGKVNRCLSSTLPQQLPQPVRHPRVVALPALYFPLVALPRVLVAVEELEQVNLHLPDHVPFVEVHVVIGTLPSSALPGVVPVDEPEASSPSRRPPDSIAYSQANGPRRVCASCSLSLRKLTNRDQRLQPMRLRRPSKPNTETSHITHDCVPLKHSKLARVDCQA